VEPAKTAMQVSALADTLPEAKLRSRSGASVK